VTGYLLSLFFLTGCGPNGKDKNSAATKHLTAVNSPDNDFNSFFNRFKTDSTFQKAHVLFPLKYKISGGEGETDTTKIITAKDWQFTRLFISNENKLILKKIKKSPTEMDIEVQIEDTGFENEFIFLKKNGNWHLHSVTDNSD